MEEINARILELLITLRNATTHKLDANYPHDILKRHETTGEPIVRYDNKDNDEDDEDDSALDSAAEDSWDSSSGEDADGNADEDADDNSDNSDNSDNNADDIKYSQVRCPDPDCKKRLKNRKTLKRHYQQRKPLFTFYYYHYYSILTRLRLSMQQSMPLLWNCSHNSESLFKAHQEE